MHLRASVRTVCVALSLVLLAAGPAAAAVSWSSAKSASAPHGFNVGGALATTKQGATSYLHQVYVNDWPGGTPAGDTANAPREAIMYQRRTTSGAASGAAVRINSKTQHGNNSSIAASGTHVYVAWVHLAKYFYGPATARTLEFRSNASHGSGAWGAVKNLTTSGRIDAPSVAASGSYVYVSYTNSDTGQIVLLISSDFGAHFHDSGLAMDPVPSSGPYGAYGFTSVAASGANVGFAWEPASGDASGWTSTNHATSKTDFVLSTGDVSGPPRVAATGARMAFGVPITTGIKMRVWQGGSLGQERLATSFAPGLTFKRSYQLGLALIGSAGLGLAFTACRLADCTSTESPAKGVDIVWRESVDNGVNWKNPVTIGPSTGTSAAGKQRRRNAYASVVSIGSKRFVIWDAFNSTYAKGSQLLRIGSGTP